jgi:TonB family protein
MRVLIASTATALICSSFAAPAIAAPLQPIIKWTVDYGVTRCTAARAFGSTTDPIFLGLIPSINGKSYKLIVSVRRSGPTYAKEYPGTVDFGRGKLKSWLLHYGTKDPGSSNYEFHLSDVEIEQARSASAAYFQSGTSIAYELALSDMPALLDALAACTADLQRYWNYNVESFTTPAKGDLRRLFRGEDYPDEAFQREQEGKAEYQLLVDEKGGVAGCDLLAQSGVPALDAMGCLVITKRARFSPAVDKTGKRVRSVVTTPAISWSIEP